ncbi:MULTISPECIES: VOC family protein [unclassified Siphonobacter]|uniref:VOC family protein n=1 Tax=unclassified Siphonobacter TaxID=2635712 RepID=UPI000CB8574E|nr:MULTISPECIES: VOC family protein [unclassified Siphonobacter]MDQ1088191.1 putative enzyme related to lactoylglutathione lyase [Siphonobacter sp. SORGH_AS_1065]MDR6194337.1 putative enzyme related to lactoylglutathione lyase [Siphonobacter sp. SORGH_AS_0500]PKK37641.1 glyoxalase/bleomycin resistance/extradiol dioxygenase family protein [Siphonobacter sp. SORGH_AS_0500]
MLQGLRTTVYLVDDLSKAKNWYSEVLATPPYFDEPFYVGFNVGGFELGLHPTDTPYPEKASVITYWAVENIHESYQRLVSLGATEHEAPHEVGGDIWVATVWDPFGNCLGIIVNPHFS